MNSILKTSGLFWVLAISLGLALTAACEGGLPHEGGILEGADVENANEEANNLRTDWTIETIEASGRVRNYLALSVDSTQAPAVVYYKRAEQINPNDNSTVAIKFELNMIRRRPTGWVNEVVPADGFTPGTRLPGYNGSRTADGRMCTQGDVSGGTCNAVDENTGLMGLMVQPAFTFDAFDNAFVAYLGGDDHSVIPGVFIEASDLMGITRLASSDTWADDYKLGGTSMETQTSGMQNYVRGFNNDVVIGPQGDLCVTFQDINNGLDQQGDWGNRDVNICCLRNTTLPAGANSWDCEPIDQDGDIGHITSIVFNQFEFQLDDAGNAVQLPASASFPVVAYWARARATFLNELRVAFRYDVSGEAPNYPSTFPQPLWAWEDNPANRWHILPLKTFDSDEFQHSLDIAQSAATGEIGLCYYDMDKRNLMYASWKPVAKPELGVSESVQSMVSDWSIVPIDKSGNTGMHCSIAFTDGGIPAISYFDVNNENLKFAYRDKNQDGEDLWRKGFVDQSPRVGQFSQLAIINGEFVIAYLDVTNGNLKFATGVRQEVE